MTERKSSGVRVVVGSWIRCLGAAVGLVVFGACSGAPRTVADAGGGEAVAVTDTPRAASADTVAWTTDVLRKARTPDGPVLLTGVRTARHDGFDRLVLEFRGAVPGYRVEGGAGPLHECGSGRPVELGTGGVVEVALSPAEAHDGEGRATVPDRDRSPELAVIRRLRSICDFEGHVGWAVGVPPGTSYRVLELGDPSRLVVDFRR